MKLPCLVSILTCAPLLVLQSRPLPLGEAARETAAELPAGGIVTAEGVGDTVVYAEAGSFPPGAAAPEDRLFEIGSITKVFTALLVAQEVVAGRLSLDATLGTLLGESVRFADPHVAAITVGQLAAHTSGLPRLPANFERLGTPDAPYAAYDDAALRQALASLRLTGPPPHAPSYSNFGYAVLGHLLTQTTGKPWADLVRERITEPLGLADTAVALTEDQRRRLVPGHAGAKPVPGWSFRVFDAAGALHSSARDLVAFGRALSRPASTPFAEAIHLLRAPRTPDGSTGLALSLLEVDGVPTLSHGGGTGGYRSWLEARPSSDQVRVVLINNDAVEAVSVIHRARNETARADQPARAVAPEELDAFVGLYPMSPQAKFTVVRNGDHLMLQLTGQPFSRLFPHEKEDRFFLKVVPAEVQFERGDAGEVTALVLHQNGVQQRAPRTEGAPPPVLFRPAEELRAYVGRYRLTGNGAVFDVRLRGDTLTVQLADQPRLPVFERRPHHFAYDVVEAALEFHPDASGAVNRLTLHQHGLALPATRVPAEP